MYDIRYELSINAAYEPENYSMFLLYVFINIIEKKEDIDNEYKEIINKNSSLKSYVETEEKRLSTLKMKMTPNMLLPFRYNVIVMITENPTQIPKPMSYTSHVFYFFNTSLTGYGRHAIEIPFHNYDYDYDDYRKIHFTRMLQEYSTETTEKMVNSNRMPSTSFIPHNGKIRIWINRSGQGSIQENIKEKPRLESFYILQRRLSPPYDWEYTNTARKFMMIASKPNGRFITLDKIIIDIEELV